MTNKKFIFILCVLILIVFFPIINHGFVTSWDDSENFINNPWVKNFNLKWAFTTTLLKVYQPVSWILLQAQYSLAPNDPAKLIHIVSIIFHMANSIIVFAILRFFSKNIIAFFSALFFALHPLQCEVIAWASCQPYLIAGFFGGLSFLFFLKSKEDESW